MTRVPEQTQPAQANPRAPVANRQEAQQPHPAADPQQALTYFAEKTVASLGILTVLLRNLPAILALLQRLAAEIQMDEGRQG